MKYNELIEKYRNGELGGEEAAEVSREIEKHEAISDYLAERDDIPELSELEADANRDETAQQDESKAFAKKVRRQIRRAFLKAGLITALAVLAAVLFCLYALPKLVDKAYYDPTEVAGVSEYGVDTNRMSLDLSVYTELFQPEDFRQMVQATPMGYGKYSIFIQQNFSLSGTFRDTAGVLDMGKLTLYDPNMLKSPVVNILDPRSAGLEADYSNEGMMGYFEPDVLDEERNVIYITFDSVKTYGEMLAWCEENEVSPFWAAVAVNGRADHPACGFRVYSGSVFQDFDELKYPYLSLISIEDKKSAEVAARHVTSLFTYAADNIGAMKMFAGGAWGSEEDMEQRLRDSAEWVKNNGLQIYGVAVTGGRELAVRLHSEVEGIAYMWANAADH